MAKNGGNRRGIIGSVMWRMANRKQENGVSAIGNMAGGGVISLKGSNMAAMKMAASAAAAWPGENNGESLNGERKRSGMAENIVAKMASMASAIESESGENGVASRKALKMAAYHGKRKRNAWRQWLAGENGGES